MEQNDDNKIGFHVQIKQMSVVHDRETYLSDNPITKQTICCTMHIPVKTKVHNEKLENNKSKF